MTGTKEIPRAWALKALWGVLTLATGVSLYMGYAHLQLTHGAGTFESLCNVGGHLNCDAVNTSEWASLFGVPISLWALPLHAALAWLVVPGQRADTRGAKARGAMTAILGWCVAFSVFLAYVAITDIGFLCLFCISLYVLYAVGFALVLLPSGGRVPAVPATEDLAPTGGLLVAITALATMTSLWYAAKLDGEVIAAIETEAVAPAPATADAGVALQIEERAAGSIDLPTEVVDVKTEPFNAAIGPADAKVTVVEYADFECGYCRKLSHELRPVKKKYADRVRFVFRHFPMDKDCNEGMSRTHHDRACEAALASECAQEQGRFWEYHDLLFANQKRLEDADLVHYAEELGLDVPAFQACIAGSTDARAHIMADVASAEPLGITGTPRTYVNGRLFKGASSRAILDAAISAALGEAETKDGRVQMRTEVLAEKPLPAGAVEMVPVTVDGTRFYIDAVESTIEGGASKSLAMHVPSTASWFEAKAACEAAGKRMCTQAEWIGACEGTVPEDSDGDGNVYGEYVAGRLFPYGSDYLPGACTDSLPEESIAGTATGSRGACRTPEGVYDLAGNLMEWVGETEARAVLVGGSWSREDKASCADAWDTFGAGYSNKSTGFRCCATELPGTVAAAPAPAPTAAKTYVADGEPLPPFEGVDLKGDPIASSLLKGKVTLVNFWASWCGPCQREMPKLAELQTRLGSRGLQVLGVNVDREATKARILERRLGVNFPSLLDSDSRYLGRFSVPAMPTSVVADRSGKVVLQHTGYSEEWIAEITAKIESLL